MNTTTRRFLFIAILLLITGCRSRTASSGPSFDQLFAFDENGHAILRGKIVGDWSCSTVNGKLQATMNIDVPILVDDIESSVDLLFVLTFETELTSNLSPYTTLRDYLAANPNSTTFDAFPLFQTVDVTFVKSGDELEAVAIEQVDVDNSAVAKIDGLISTDLFSRGTLNGTIWAANWGEDLVTWTLSMPVTVQGVSSSVLIPIQANDQTQVIANGSDTPMDIYHPGGDVQVEFSRSGDTLNALRFTEMP